MWTSSIIEGFFESYPFKNIFEFNLLTLTQITHLISEII